MADVRIDQRGIHELFNSPDGDMAKAMERTLIRVESGAKRLCPVDTGRLRSSITHEVYSDGHGVVGRVGTNVDYAPFVELGTSHMAAQPFLRPSLIAELGKP